MRSRSSGGSLKSGESTTDSAGVGFAEEAEGVWSRSATASSREKGNEDSLREVGEEVILFVIFSQLAYRTEEDEL